MRFKRDKNVTRCKSDVSEIRTSGNCLETLDIPPEIIERYHAFGIYEMFDWQRQCLSTPAAVEGKSVVLCAPTSAGKTFIADITAIRQLQRCGRKVIIVLPFISVAREKLVWLENLLHPLGYKIGGYMGPQHPSLPFDKLNIAICTIEKANSLINAMIREKRLQEIGLVIVDELHTICDPSRGYLLELLLTKLLYVTLDSPVPPQILGMSATLPNSKLLAQWLRAELFITDFRPVPLTEFIKCNDQLMDKNLNVVRKLESIGCAGVRDEEFVLSLVIETLVGGQSVLIFCPSKQWCESLAGSLAREMAILREKKHPVVNKKPLEPLNLEDLEQVAIQLYRSPAGLDSVLSKTLSSGVAFHHAGLTIDERDIIESAFRRCVIRVLVATSTLSSGVNLPSRRVIIRSVMAGGAPIDVLSYRQMAGRAGRKGVDSLGESVLICKPTEKITTGNLVKADLPPLKSCLVKSNTSISNSMKRAVLEVIAGGVAQTHCGLNGYLSSTLFAAECNNLGDQSSLSSSNTLDECVKFLISHKFIQVENCGEGLSKQRYVPSQLGLATLHAAMAPDDALALISDLDRARQSLCLDSELHLVFLVTPINAHWPEIDWRLFSGLWDTLPTELRRVGVRVGVNEAYIAKAVAGRVSSSDIRLYRIHVRFLTSLMLLDLVNEMPLMRVAHKYNVNRGFVQSLQQQAATFAGMTATFARELCWRHFDSLLASFQSRIAFGVQPELVELLEIPFLTASVVRHLFKNGIRRIEELATSDVAKVERILHRFRPFESVQQEIAEDEAYVASEIPLTDRPSITPSQAAQFFSDLAKQVFQAKHGENVKLMIQGQVASENGMSTVSPEPSHSVAKTRASSKKRDSSKLVTPPEPSSSEKKRRKASAASFISPSPIVMGQSTLDLFQSSLNTTNGPCFTPVYHGISLSQPHATSSQNRLSIGGVIGASLLGDASLLEALEKVEMNEKNKFPSSNATSKFSEGRRSYPTASSTPANSQKSKPINHPVEFSPINDSLVGRMAAECEAEINVKKVLEPKDNFIKPMRPARPITPLGTANQQPRVEREEAIVGMKTKEERPVVETEEESIELSLNIVEVAANRRLFAAFVAEWTRQKHFGISVSTAKIRPDSMAAVTDLNLAIEDGQRVVGVAISYGEPYDVYYLSLLPPTDQNTPDKEYAEDDFLSTLPRSDVISIHARVAALRKVLQICKSESCISSFDARRQLRLLYQIGITPRCVFFDPRLAHWIMDPSAKAQSFHSLVLTYCNEAMTQLASSVTGCKARCSIASDDSPALARRFACVEAVAVRPLMHEMRQKLEDIDLRLLSAFEEIESPTDAIIAKMEMNGIGIDLTALEKLRQRMQTKMMQLEKEAQVKSGGRRFALSSPEDVAKVLFQDLRLPMDPDHIRRSGGRVVCSTNKTVLSRLRNKHPLPDIVMQWRRLSSALTKSVLAIEETVTEAPDVLPAPGSRVFFECALIATGRINIIRPCLQLVPKDIPAEIAAVESCELSGVEDDEDGVDEQTDAQLAPFSLRHVFVPSEGAVLLTADYSQIELRLIAHLSKEKNLIAALCDQSVDVFRQITADWNDIEGGAEVVTDEQRAHTKQLVYAMLYGVGTKTLAGNMGVSGSEASNFLLRFQGKYPGIRAFINRTVAYARQNGFITTLMGRRRRIGNSNRRQKMKEPIGRIPPLTEHAERQAVNSIVQGSAADIVKQAMLDIDKELRKKFTSQPPPFAAMLMPHEALGRSEQRRNERGARLVLHMHDELVYEVVKRDLAVVADIVRNGMENAVQLAVPMPVKVKSGPSWADQIAM